MNRRKFLGISMGGGFALSRLANSPVAVASGDERYARMREERREFEDRGSPDAIGLNAQFPLPRNGRQLARRRDGTWFFTYASHVNTFRDSAGVISYTANTEIRMSSSRPAAAGHTPGFGFDEVLIRRHSGYNEVSPKSLGHVIGGDGGGDYGTEPSMVIDASDVLHLVWTRPATGEVYYARCDVSGQQGTARVGITEAWQHGDAQGIGAERIADEEAALGDICLDGNGHPCIAFRHRDGITLTRYDGRWRQKAVIEGKGLAWPTLHCDRQGTLHVIWVDSNERLYYLKSENGGDAWVAADGKNKAPDFIGGFCIHGPSLAVADHQVFVAQFVPQRVIAISRYDGREWTRNVPLEVGGYDHGSPVLTVDKHDVPWLHAVGPYNWSRTTRWLGNGWGDLQEGRRLDNLARVCSAERVMGPEADEFGVILADNDHRLHFKTFAVPSPAAARGKHFMFLDLWEVAALAGVEQVVEPMEKDSRNPLMKHGEPGTFDEAEANFQGTILKEGNKYRMWYTGSPTLALLGDQASACGYAESTDGVQWTKPDLGLYEFNGSKHNNICYPKGYQFAVLRMPDDFESDPAKRYRMAYNSDKGSSLAFSPDGIHWKASPDNPLWDRGRAGEPDSNIAENGIYVYDPADPDPERRFKSYPQTVDDGGERTIGLMYSPDGIHFKRYWTNPIMDGRTGVEKQTHLMEVLFRRHGVFVALYGRYLEDDRTDAALAVSRDGIHFVRVKDEVPLIPNGALGSFDAGDVWPSNQPMVEGKDLWIYYSGTDLTLAGGDGLSSMGRTRTRVDGFAKMRLKAGQSHGNLTTVPFSAEDVAGARLVVNLESREPGKGNLRVEILDAATGQAAPGYSGTDCHPISEDGLALPVTWGNNIDLSGVKAKQIRLRFHFSGSVNSPRLCSFGFE
jgi:hypothetical protein